MKYILRTFGLVSIKDVNKLLNTEAKHFEDQRKNLEKSEDILIENSINRLEHYAQCLKDFKLSIYLLNKWW